MVSERKSLNKPAVVALLVCWGLLVSFLSVFNSTPGGSGGNLLPEFIAGFVCCPWSCQDVLQKPSFHHLWGALSRASQSNPALFGPTWRSSPRRAPWHFRFVLFGPCGEEGWDGSAPVDHLARDRVQQDGGAADAKGRDGGKHKTNVPPGHGIVFSPLVALVFDVHFSARVRHVHLR